MIEELVRKNIRSLKPYTSARDMYNEGILLDANENSFGSVIESEEQNLNRYPDPMQISMRKTLAEYLNVSYKKLFFGVGSDEIIDLLIRIFCSPGKDSVLIPEPTYGMYKVAADINDIKTETVLLNDKFNLDPDALLNKLNPGTKIIFLCSPNNPSGNLLPEASLRAIVENTRALVFVDEAYVEFAERNLAGLVCEYDNLAVGRTFSKVFGLAGLRLGYGIMPEWLVKEYIRAATPFSVSLPALKAGIAALSDVEHLRKSIEITREGREYLREKISFKVYPSQANFVLVDVAPLKAKAVTENLMRKGIIVRSCDSFREAGDTFIRVTVGTPEQNEKVVKAFKAAKKEI